MFIFSKIIFGRVEEDLFGLLKGRSKSTDFIFLNAESAESRILLMEHK